MSANEDYAIKSENVELDRILLNKYTKEMKGDNSKGSQNQFTSWINYRYKNADQPKQFKIFTPVMTGFTIPKYDPSNEKLSFIKSETDETRYKIKPVLKQDTEEEKKFYNILKYIDDIVKKKEFTAELGFKEYNYYPIIRIKEDDNGGFQEERMSIKIPKNTPAKGESVTNPTLKCGVMEITAQKKKKVISNPTITKLASILKMNSKVTMIIKISRVWASRTPLGGNSRVYGVSILLDYILIDNSDIKPAIKNPFGDPDEIEDGVTNKVRKVTKRDIDDPDADLEEDEDEEVEENEEEEVEVEEVIVEKPKKGKKQVEDEEEYIEEEVIEEPPQPKQKSKVKKPELDDEDEVEVIEEEEEEPQPKQKGKAKKAVPQEDEDEEVEEEELPPKQKSKVKKPAPEPEEEEEEVEEVEEEEEEVKKPSQKKVVKKQPTPDEDESEEEAEEEAQPTKKVVKKVIKKTVQQEDDDEDAFERKPVKAIRKH